MTVKECKNKILHKYKVGQEVNLRIRTQDGKISERKKAEIVRYYPNLVYCKVGAWHESFSYQELYHLTTY